MKNAVVKPVERETVDAPLPRGRETGKAWRKPALEKLPLSEAQTGTTDGSSDSELYS